MQNNGVGKTGYFNHLHSKYIHLAFCISYCTCEIIARKKPFNYPLGGFQPAVDENFFWI